MTIQITPNTILERLDDAMISTTVDEGLVGLSMKTDKCYSMNATATRIWELLETQQSAEAVSEQLCTEFDGPKEQIAAQTLRVLHSLSNEGLVRAIS